MAFISGKPTTSEGSTTRKSYVSAEAFNTAYRLAVKRGVSVKDIAESFGYTPKQLLQRVRTLNGAILDRATNLGVTLPDDAYLPEPVLEGSTGKRGRKATSDTDFLTRIMGITLPTP